MKRVGIVGCGNIHHMHAKALQKLNDVNLVAVCDCIIERAQKTAQEYNVENVYSDYLEMLEKSNLDVLHITTPHYLHAQMAIQAMKAGADVIIEKPLAMTLEEAYEVADVCKTTGKRLGICFQNRFNQASQKMKQLIESGKAGKVLGSSACVLWNRSEDYYNADKWRGTWKYEGGGVLINQSIHTLDLQMWLTGKPTKVYGNKMTSLLKNCIEVEDTAMATFEYEDGKQRGTFFATNCAASDLPVRLDIECESCKMSLSDGLVITYNDGTKEFVEEKTGKGEKAYWGYGHELLIKNFYECFEKDIPFSIGVDAGIATLEVINEIKYDKI